MKDFSKILDTIKFSSVENKNKIFVLSSIDNKIDNFHVISHILKNSNVNQEIKIQKILMSSFLENIVIKNTIEKYISIFQKYLIQYHLKQEDTPFFLFEDDSDTINENSKNIIMNSLTNSLKNYPEDTFVISYNLCKNLSFVFDKTILNQIDILIDNYKKEYEKYIQTNLYIKDINNYLLETENKIMNNSIMLKQMIKEEKSIILKNGAL